MVVNLKSAVRVIKSCRKPQAPVYVAQEVSRPGERGAGGSNSRRVVSLSSLSWPGERRKSLMRRRQYCGAALKMSGIKRRSIASIFVGALAAWQSHQLFIGAAPKSWQSSAAAPSGLSAAMHHREYRELILFGGNSIMLITPPITQQAK